MKKQILSMLLAVVMVLGLIPWSAMPVEAETQANGYEYAWFPAPIMNLTQIAYESYSHGSQNAIDIAPGGTVFAPFTGKIVYADANWGYVVLQSIDKVYWADGTCDYMSVGFMHDENISDLYVGKVISQGQKFYHAGGMGNGNPNAYGDHVHLTVHRGQVTRGYPYGTGDEFAFDAFYVNRDKTTGTSGRGEGYAASGSTVSNGAPKDYRGLWIDLPEYGNYVKKAYTAYCEVEVTSSQTYIKSLPCSKETAAESADVEIAKKGDHYIAIGLYENVAGNLWYKVISKTGGNGGVGYLFAGDTNFLKQLTDDVTISGVSAPTELEQGKAFSIKGVISTKYQTISQVGAWVNDANGKFATGTTETKNCTSYNLLNSNVDYGVKFNELAVGNYTYYVGVTLVTHYATSAKEYSTKQYTITDLYTSTFSVVKDTSCSHSYSTAVIAPTCTERGYTTYTCKSCGYSYNSDYVEAIGHNYGAWEVTAEPGCTQNGVEACACVNCGDVQVRDIGATGHNYSVEAFGATCVAPAFEVHTCVNCGDTYTVTISGEEFWTTEKPTGVDESLIESRTEYRYQFKEYTTSTNSVMDGWTHYNTTLEWGEYGAWSDWSDTAVSGSDSTMVETRTVYGYYYFLCPKCGDHMHGYGSCWTWAGGCGATTTESCWRAVWSTVSWDDAGLKDWYGTGKYYTYIDGQLVFKWSSGGSKTQYRSCTREQQSVYHFYKWSDWSEWGTDAVTADENTNVETRTVYRYLGGDLAPHDYETYVTPPTCTEQGYTLHICKVCWEDWYEDTYVDPLGHDHNYTATSAPTTNSTGLLTGTCSRCPDTVTVTLPNLNTSDYTYTVVEEPSYTESGIGRYTWNDTTYGTFYFDVVLDQLVLPEYESFIQVERVEALPGETVTVTIALDNNPGITSMKLNVAFDSILTLTNISFNQEIGGQFQTSQSMSSPVILNWFSGITDVEGDFVFATLTFVVSEDAQPGTFANVTITYNPDDVFDVAENNIPFGVENGGVEVKDYLPGDINGDGTVNNKDVARLFQYLSDWDVEVVEKALDVNGDGSINNKDVIRLFRYLSGWDVELC